jgi:hypothetical protein
MPIGVVVILLIFWIFMAYRAFERGDIMMAVIFLAVGVALTFYRMRARQPK